jgi:hypothetical protein
LQPTILYAKFTILVKDEDFSEAETVLRNLLKAPNTSFETALNAVKILIDDSWSQILSSSGQSKLEYYKLLSIKFPRFVILLKN